VLLVLLLDEVEDDGTRLPEGEVGVGVLDGWQAAVWVDGEIRWFLDVFPWDPNCLVRKAEFLKENLDLGRVRATSAPEFDGFELGGGAHSRSGGYCCGLPENSGFCCFSVVSVGMMGQSRGLAGERFILESLRWFSASESCCPLGSKTSRGLWVCSYRGL